MNSEDAFQHGTNFLSVAALALQMALYALAYLALGSILWVGETIIAVFQRVALRRDKSFAKNARPHPGPGKGALLLN